MLRHSVPRTIQSGCQSTDRTENISTSIQHNAAAMKLFYYTLHHIKAYSASLGKQNLSSVNKSQTGHNRREINYARTEKEAKMQNRHGIIQVTHPESRSVPWIFSACVTNNSVFHWLALPHPVISRLVSNCRRLSSLNRTLGLVPSPRRPLSLSCSVPAVPTERVATPTPGEQVQASGTLWSRCVCSVRVLQSHWARRLATEKGVRYSSTASWSWGSNIVNLRVVFLRHR